MSDPRQLNIPRPLAKLDQFDFHARLAETTGTTLVVFTAPACGSCRHLLRVLHEVRHLQPDWSVFEVDAQRDQALTNEFEVFHLPTIFLFSAGEFHCLLEAEAHPSAVIEAVTAALQQRARETP